MPEGNSKVKRKNTMLRIAVWKLIYALEDEGLDDCDEVDCARQALAAKTDDDLDTWFNDWPDED